MNSDLLATSTEALSSTEASSVRTALALSLSPSVSPKPRRFGAFSALPSLGGLRESKPFSSFGSFGGASRGACAAQCRLLVRVWEHKSAAASDPM